MPTFFWGTKREHSEKMLKNIGFKGDEWIVGDVVSEIVRKKYNEINKG